MILAGRPAKILLIDTNVYFSKRLSDALKREGFEVNASTQPAFALTTLEYDTPSAIVCSTNMRELGALDIARMIRADAKNAVLPVIALGDGSQRALMEAFQAGCDDYIDRSRPPAIIATHIKNIIVSKAEGFQPTQMLAQSDTSLSGSLTHHDLPGVMQMLGHAHQTGALHINSGNTDALIFFDAGTITHAECASLFGDEAVIHILKNCFQNNSGVYKFVYGSSSGRRSVLRSATDLMLDAMREVDESTREPEVDLSALATETDADAFTSSLGAPADPTPCAAAAVFQEIENSAVISSDQAAKPEHTDDAPALASLLENPADEQLSPESEFSSLDEPSAELHSDDSDVIASLIDRYAASPPPNNSQSDSLEDLSVGSQPGDSCQVASLIERPAGTAPGAEIRAAALQQISEVAQRNDKSSMESLTASRATGSSFQQSESGLVEEHSEPSLLGDSADVESLIERPAIWHSNNFSAAMVPNGQFVAPSSALVTPEDHSSAMATADDHEVSAVPQDQAEVEPKVDLPAVVDEVFRLAVTDEAGNLVAEPDAEQNADTPDKESL